MRVGQMPHVGQVGAIEHGGAADSFTPLAFGRC
jgi:hypothetical protein